MLNKKLIIIVVLIFVVSCGSNNKKPVAQNTNETQSINTVTEKRPIEKTKSTPPIQEQQDPELAKIEQQSEVVKSKEIKAVGQQPPAEIKPAPITQLPVETNSQPIAQIVKKPEPKPAVEKKTRSLQGKIKFIKNSDAKIESTIVYFKPEDGQYPLMQANVFEVTTQNKRFVPCVMAIPVGSEVKFPNLDRILHNVFSVSTESSFDLGLYSAGTVKSVKFEKPGIIYVHCNVHHSMQADILVLDTPWYTSVNKDGTFKIDNIPNRAGTLSTWHPRANIVSQKMDATTTSKLNLNLKITRQKVPKQLNKFGKSYRPEKK